MGEKELVTLLESYNMSIRTPSKEFFELKQEYDTDVVPRRRALKQLCNILDCNKSSLVLADDVIKKMQTVEDDFIYRLLINGELQEKFFSEDFPYGDINFYFKYSMKIKDIPSEILSIFIKNGMVLPSFNCAKLLLYNRKPKTIAYSFFKKCYTLNEKFALADCSYDDSCGFVYLGEYKIGATVIYYFIINKLGIMYFDYIRR